jgi:hypothetical protein
MNCGTHKGKNFSKNQKDLVSNYMPNYSGNKKQ